MVGVQAGEFGVAGDRELGARDGAVAVAVELVEGARGRQAALVAGCLRPRRHGEGDGDQSAPRTGPGRRKQWVMGYGSVLVPGGPARGAG